MITNAYHNAIRDILQIARTKGNSNAFIIHQIGSDEVHDPSLVSYRVYGNREDYDVVMVCAGTNAIWQPLPEKLIVLPTPTQLFQIKQKYNAFSDSLLALA